MADRAGLVTAPCLISEDEALICLIVTEAQELALPLTVVSTLSEALQQRCNTVLLDLDNARVCEAVMASDGTWDMIGICRDFSTLPDRITDQLRMRIERPFSTAKLREVLSRWRGNSVFLTQDADVQPSSTAIVSMAASVPLAMENSTTLCYGDERIRLTPKEAALMRCLLAHRGEVVRREMLDECLQSAGKESADSNKTEVYLCFLRRKLERPLGLRLITTVRGVGYRLE